MRDLLSGKLTPEEIRRVFNSYDVVGDIAIIRLDDSMLSKAEIIAEAIMQTQKRVKTVLRQASPVEGTFRTRRLMWVRGEKCTETEYKEFGCRFRVDLAKVYFSPRLSHERMRIARKVAYGEVIVNMFAGVGTYSIIIAKYANPRKVYSIDISPYAFQYMVENIKLNKVGNVVEPILGDARKVIEESLTGVADRVLMPLPEKAIEYVDSAISALKPGGGWIHYYSFEHARRDEDPIKKSIESLDEKLKSLGVDYEVAFGRIVRETGPNWYQVALDIRVKKE